MWKKGILLFGNVAVWVGVVFLCLNATVLLHGGFGLLEDPGFSKAILTSIGLMVVGFGLNHLANR